MKKQPLRYLTRIYWSDEDEGFVAEVPALQGCIGVGDTQANALREVTKSVRLWLKSAAKHGDPIPEPGLAREEIERVSPFLNLSKLALRAGLNKSTLASKLRRKSPFTESEAKAILKALDPG
jgi:predicted RNase H-like HicB family nuclease